MKKVITTPDNVDVTAKVQVLYDSTVGSMDWGSGFLDNEEMEAVVEFAIHMGWRVPDLNGSPAAMRTVAQKYPDHYEITERQAESAGRMGNPIKWTVYQIKVKEQPS